MKYIRLLSRIILGIVFIFSGFVKALDPLGSAYKFSDYFTAFRIGFLDFTAIPLAILLSSFELALGMTLVLGYRRRVTYTILMWFMLLFTLLTLALAIFNPVSDCGCFGDALILTNWQTFLKNVVLMVFVMVLFMNRKKEAAHGLRLREWAVIVSIYAGICLFSIWNYRHIPVLDFRPYDVGTMIEKEMVVPEGAPVDEYETTLTYRNRSNGKEAEFGIDDYPRDTSMWEFVSSESRLVKKGDEPAIHDFAIMDENGTDLTDRILSDPGYSLLMVSCDLGKADEQALKRAGDWSRLEILAEDFSFFAVTASTGQEVKATASALDLDYPFFSADDIMLKTMIRSNPGFMLIRDGIIIGKWGFRDFPLLEQVDPTVVEMIGNAAAPMDEETQMLMEAGVYEDFSYNVVDFNTLVPALVYEGGNVRLERSVVAILILAISVIILLSGLVSPIRI
jgi:uncharacterized membrane protein YphA (DoxX/SURF4 family)